MAQLQCELTIVKLTNLYIDLQPGMLFIRYCVNAGGGRRIRIDTRQISSNSALRWDETSYLECMVPPDSIKKVVCEHNVAFELRWRSANKPIFAIVSKRSKLLGRAEVAWEGISVEKSIGLDLEKKSLMEGLKAPTLVVRMGIRVRVLQLREKRKDKHEDMGECKCESCRWIAIEEDMFLAATSATMLDTW